MPSSRKVNGKALSGDISLGAGDVGAFKLGSSGDYSYKNGVPWNASTGIYDLRYPDYSLLIAHFSDGIGSCPAFQLQIGNRNSGIAYRSARDSYGFEEDWTSIYTTRNKPSAEDVGAYSKSESDNQFIKLNTNTKTSGYILSRSANYFDDPNSRNLGLSGFLRPNQGLDGLGALAIHVAHPQCAGPEYSRGISFGYGGGFSISTYAFDKDGKFTGSKRILTEDDINEDKMPVGAPIPWPQKNPPSGYLTCNGQAFNKSTYPQLAAAYPSGTLPDLRGEFIRGWDDGRGVDSGRGILSYQEGQAPVSAIAGYWGNNWNDNKHRDTGFSAATGTNNGSFHTIIQEYESQRETRPRNIAFNYIVRAA